MYVKQGKTKRSPELAAIDASSLWSLAAEGGVESGHAASIAPALARLEALKEQLRSLHVDDEKRIIEVCMLVGFTLHTCVGCSWFIYGIAMLQSIATLLRRGNALQSSDTGEWVVDLALNRYVLGGFSCASYHHGITCVFAMMGCYQLCGLRSSLNVGDVLCNHTC